MAVRGGGTALHLCPRRQIVRMTGLIDGIRHGESLRTGAEVARVTAQGALRPPPKSSTEGVDSVQMNISIRHGHVSDATQAMIREKLEKLTRLYDRISAIEVTIDLEHRDAARGRSEGVGQEARLRGGWPGGEPVGRGRRRGRQDGAAIAETQGEGSRPSSRHRAPGRPKQPGEPGEGRI